MCLARLPGEKRLAKFSETVIVDHFTRKSDICHGVEDDSVRNVIADLHDLAVEAGLNSVYILSLPQSYRHEWRADVYQHRPRQAACQLLNYVGLRLANSPPQHLDVLVDLFSGDL